MSSYIQGKPFKFVDESFSAVFGNRLLSVFSDSAIKNIVKETNRVLQPGSKVTFTSQGGLSSAYIEGFKKLGYQVNTSNSHGIIVLKPN